MRISEPSFYGDSTGKWEGNTLVVDTVNIKDTVPLAGGMYHSDKIHITERIHLDPKDADKLLVEVTVTRSGSAREALHECVRVHALARIQPARVHLRRERPQQTGCRREHHLRYHQ